jgi:hypothetical protein
LSQKHGEIILHGEKQSAFGPGDFGVGDDGGNDCCNIILNLGIFLINVAADFFFVGNGGNAAYFLTIQCVATVLFVDLHQN